MNKLLLVCCVSALGTSAGCALGGRQTPQTTPTTAAAVPAIPPGDRTVPPPYRPRHQGSIDITTGLYIRNDDDLVVNTAMPIVLRRTYLSEDRYVRRFGIGATHAGEWWLAGDGDPRVSWANLILDDGRSLHFKRISPGNTQEGAVLRYDGAATEFHGGLLVWNGSKWELRFADGALAFFLDCQGDHDVCSLVDRRDAQGHRVVYRRDTTGRLLSMESEGQSIALDYDDRKRIVRAYDTASHVMDYTYDTAGRLVRASRSDGTVRDYTYDDQDQLIKIRDPNRIVQNWFDADGRVIRQEVRWSENDQDPYVATVRYTVEGTSVTQVDFDEGDGVQRYRYNSARYVVSATFHAESRAPVTFTYDREPSTNALIGFTMSCLGPSGPITQSMPLSVAAEADATLARIGDMCRLGYRFE